MIARGWQPPWTATISPILGGAWSMIQVKLLGQTKLLKKAQFFSKKERSPRPLPELWIYFPVFKTAEREREPKHSSVSNWVPAGSPLLLQAAFVAPSSAPAGDQTSAQGSAGSDKSESDRRKGKRRFILYSLHAGDWLDAACKLQLVTKQDTGAQGSARRDKSESDRRKRERAS